MVQKITWSHLAVPSFSNNIEYLQKEWINKEIEKFIKAIERKLELLKSQPEIGALTNKRHSVRKTLIGKRIILIYRYNKRKNEIELLRFFNSWQHPGKMKTS